jgi:protein phosphatase
MVRQSAGADRNAIRASRRLGASWSVGLSAVSAAAAHGVDVGDLRSRVAEQLERSERFAASVRHYCWPVSGIEGIRIAPFHLLAGEGAAHHGKPHDWHMATLAKLASSDPLFQTTQTRRVDFADETSVEAAVAWWLEMTESGGEGMVVKPLDFVARGHKGLVQPAVKCRGRDYLRIIYGPDYDAPQNIERLRKRGLAGKRALAIREFALGIEALERFTARLPLRRVHECVFGVLALESEPIDPRL